jgi:hypothetical protein
MEVITMQEKIIQIMPAPAGLLANYETGKLDEQGQMTCFTRPVTCLALVEVTTDSGIRSEVRAMRPAHGCDQLEFATGGDKFVAITHKGE